MQIIEVVSEQTVQNVPSTTPAADISLPKNPAGNESYLFYFPGTHSEDLRLLDGENSSEGFDVPKYTEKTIGPVSPVRGQLKWLVSQGAGGINVDVHVILIEGSGSGFINESLGGSPQLDFLQGRDFDEAGVSSGGSYGSVSFSDLSDIQDSNDWIDVRGRIRASLQAVASGEAQDVRVRGKFSDNAEPEIVNEELNILTGAANAENVLKGQDIEAYSYLQVEQRDNGQDGGGSVDHHGNTK